MLFNSTSSFRINAVDVYTLLQTDNDETHKAIKNEMSTMNYWLSEIKRYDLFFRFFRFWAKYSDLAVSSSQGLTAKILVQQMLIFRQYQKCHVPILFFYQKLVMIRKINIILFCGIPLHQNLLETMYIPMNCFPNPK